MNWNVLGSLFCLELAFGTFVFLWLVSKAPLSPFFHRMNGAFAALFLFSAVWMDRDKRFFEGTSGTSYFLGLTIAVLSYLGIFLSISSSRRRLMLALAVLGSGIALFAAVFHLEDGNVFYAIFAAVSGLVVAGVAVAMVVGHCYLTVPNLDISYLANLNRWTMWAIAFKLFCLLCAFLLFVVLANAPHFGGGDVMSPTMYFYLGTRVLVGLIMPLIFAWMVSGCLKHKSTRSATGILYASTVLVIIGEAIELSLWSSR